MQAVILAGGKGARLRPYTSVLPKALMPIVDMPIVEIVLRQLKHYGFNTIIIAVGHLSHLIQSFFGNGKQWGVEIKYSIENQPLGTAGPLTLISDLDENFLVINADVLTDLNFSTFMKYHIEKGGHATLAYCKRDITVSLGSVEVDETDKLTDYKEKPVLSYKASMGIYCMNKIVLNFMQTGKYKDLPELMINLIKKGMIVYTYPFRGMWFDIGRTEDYDIVICEYEKNKNRFLPM